MTPPATSQIPARMMRAFSQSERMGGLELWRCFAAAARGMLRPGPPGSGASCLPAFPRAEGVPLQGAAAPGSSARRHLVLVEKRGIQVREVLQLQSRDTLPDKPFDRAYVIEVLRRKDRKRIAQQLRPPCPADPVHVI